MTRGSVDPLARLENYTRNPYPRVSNPLSTGAMTTLQDQILDHHINQGMADLDGMILITLHLYGTALLQILIPIGMDHQKKKRCLFVIIVVNWDI